MVASNGEEARRDLPPSTPYAWPGWYVALTPFQKGGYARAGWQLANTLVPYAALWYGMVLLLREGFPYWTVLALAVPAAGFLVRVFIFFHDCVHGSFVPSKGGNTALGYLCGVLTFTPLEDWRYTHLRHHVTYANLDARGLGDIWTLTLAEYRSSSRLRRFLYRFYRHPFVMFGLGPLSFFLVVQRLPSAKAGRVEVMSVLFTDLLIVLVALLAGATIGWKSYLLIQLPVLWLAGAAGIWLFYVQHQFEGVYWARKGAWDPLRAAFEGSSFYDLPLVLRWFSGNIGYHYIHHLRPRIPNYRLKACYDAVAALRLKRPLTVRQSLSSRRVKLWDEERGRLVGFADA